MPRESIERILCSCDEWRSLFLRRWPRDSVISTYANKLPLQAKIIRKCLRKRQIRKVALHAYRLGLQVGTLAGESLYLTFQPHMERGLKVLRGGKAGHEKTYGSRLVKLLDGAGLQNEVENLQRKLASLSLTSARRIVAKEHRINPRTLLRRTSPFLKKK